MEMVADLVLMFLISTFCVVLTLSWCKKGGYGAGISPKSELCGFKWANTHSKCVHDSMQLANSSPNACLLWMHYIWY